MISVNVRFFGAVRGITDEPGVRLELDGDATLADLLKELHDRYGQKFYDQVLCESNGVKGHIKLFMNDEEVDRRKLSTTKLEVRGETAETLLYVLPSTAGG